MVFTSSDVVVRVTLTKDCIVPRGNLASFLKTIQQQPRAEWLLNRYGIGGTCLLVGTEQIGALGDLGEAYREHFVTKQNVPNASTSQEDAEWRELSSPLSL